MSKTTDKRISLWSGPRNVSTALMYSFAQRPDTKVIDEPLYGHYLSKTEVEHPGGEEVINHMELNGASVVSDICNNDYGKPVLFIKNMAHHLVSLDWAFLDNLHNLLLIRDPKEMIPSMINQLPNPILRDTALKRQWEIYQHLKSKGESPVVIDSRELLLDPKKILSAVCDHLDIPYYDAMTHWKAGSIAEDGIWAKHWYHSVHKSTGFQAYHRKEEKVPDRLLDLLETCDSYYQKLFQNAVKAG